MDAVRFLLDDKLETVRGIDPTTTVLQWLRANGHTGTKEGCAEGDCGACTVALGEPGPDGKIVYRAVNACILFVPVLDGKQLVTVEHLKDASGALHPVQQAMVECHGSQCGFCTPGFVMSLFALYHGTDAAPEDGIVHDAIAGNLCRCTGYRPIVAAARQALNGKRGDRFQAQAGATREALRALQPRTSLALDGQGKRYYAPRSLAELSSLLAQHPDAHLLAGGTDVGLWVTKQHRDLACVIYLGSVAELDTVEETGSQLEIGAGASYTRLLPVFQRLWPSFGEMLRRLGSVQIRNSGTMGGNVANGSPIGDSMPALIALRASVVLNKAGKRRTLPLEDFYLGYRKTALGRGEFVERLTLPIDPAWRFLTYKLSKRFDQDISAVALGMAVKLERDTVADVRIAFGGMAATPKRARAAEAALKGQAWSEANVLAAAERLPEDFQPLTDMRASAAYRALGARNLLRRFYLESAGEPVRLGVEAHA
jgi:xanthine dehydrogenase small subunit